jgi:hypothetical protein
MQNTDWIELFHLIPAEQQNILVLTTVSGMDLNIEMILRTEPSVLVFRGRVQGSTDDGRVFFLPYRQIDFLQINRFVRENEIQEMFAKAAPPEPAEKPPERPSRVFAAVSPHSSAIYSSTGEAPPAAPRPAPAAPVRLSGSQLGRLQTSVLVPENAAAAGAENGDPSADALAPPRSSILERLRAQRNAVMPPQPPGR